MSYIRTKEIPPRSGNWYKRVDSGYSPLSGDHTPVSLAPTLEPGERRS